MNSKNRGAARDVWLELRLSPAEYTRGASDAPAPPVSSSSGSGSAGAGYGLGLIVPEHFSRERILRIMRELCAQDEARQEPHKQ